MAGVELCHLFFFVTPGAPEAAPLIEAGWCESFRRRHPGQGTANVCYCFDNGYLELLWVEAPAELEAPAIARTGLAERAAWRDNFANPFGIGVRSDLSVSCWDYRPPYLPDGMTIPIARDSADPGQPFIFRSPGSSRPDTWQDGRAGVRQRPAGLAEIVAVDLDLPAPPCDALQVLAGGGWLNLGWAARPELRLRLSTVHGGPEKTLRLPGFTLL